MINKFSITLKQEDIASIYSDKDISIRIDTIITSKSEEILELASVMRDVLIHLPCITEVEKNLIIASLTSSSKVLIAFQEIFKINLVCKSIMTVFEKSKYNVKENILEILDDRINELIKKSVAETVATLTKEDYRSFLIELFV